MIFYVFLVWLGAACISLPPLLIIGNEHTYSETGPSHCSVCQNFFYQIYATLGSFYIPLLVMIQVSIESVARATASRWPRSLLHGLISCFFWGEKETNALALRRSEYSGLCSEFSFPV